MKNNVPFKLSFNEDKTEQGLNLKWQHYNYSSKLNFHSLTFWCFYEFINCATLITFILTFIIKRKHTKLILSLKMTINYRNKQNNLIFALRKERKCYPHMLINDLNKYKLKNIVAHHKSILSTQKALLILTHCQFNT